MNYYKKILFAFVFLFLVFNLPVVSADESDGGLFGGEGNLLSGSLKSVGYLAGGYLVPQLVTSLFMGSNAAAGAITQKTAGIGALGSLVGAGFLGKWGGAIGGFLGGLAGGIWGAISFSGSTLATLQRGIVTRVITLEPTQEGTAIYDTKYKILGSDQPSGKFSASLKGDKNFVKKEKDVFYQYTPVMLKIEDGKSVSTVENVTLQIGTFGLPEYIYKIPSPNPNATSGLNPVATQPFGDSLDLGDEAKQKIGWCHAGDDGRLVEIDKKVSKEYVEVKAAKEKKAGKESFVLLLKKLKPEEEEINIPNFNCFGPNGLTGVTGEQEMPRVSYDWSSDSIDENFCTIDIKDSKIDIKDSKAVYCDSTQFTVSLLSRLKLISGSLNSIKENFTSTADLNIGDNDAKKKLYAFLNFRAYMMKDGFTKDFLVDFEDYVTKTSYLDFPKNEQNIVSGLMPDKILFRPLSGESVSPEGYKLPQAGYYNVTVEIVYVSSSGNKKLFELSGNLNTNVSKIYIYFEPITYEPNPVYYMPLDATVGVNNGIIDRIGYGVDYSGDGIWFKKESGNPLLLEPSMSSNLTSIVHLDMTVKQDTQTLNGPMKGTVLQIIPKSGALGATYSVNRYLSLPAKADLEIKKESDGGAWAFYTIDFGNGPETAGSSFILWSLMCEEDDTTCETFNGLKQTDEMFVPDKLGVHAKVAPTGQLQGKVYGLEWDKDSIIRDDKHKSVNYRGLVYLPESVGSGTANIISASDNATITPSSLTSVYDSISDIASIYDLMESDKICMSKDGSGIRFWWNPAKAMDTEKD